MAVLADGHRAAPRVGPGPAWWSISTSPAVAERHPKRGPLGQGVVAGLAEQALGQVPGLVPGLVPEQGAVEAFDDEAARAGANGGAERGAGVLFAEDRLTW